MAQILDAEGVEAALDAIAREIVARDDPARLAIVGVHRRGVPLAERLAAKVGALCGAAPPTGALDITLYRDDLSMVADQPVVHGTDVPWPVDGLRVVLTDDVLFTGRTTRAAIEALLSLGRPARIELAVLVDRGHRELPIEATYVGTRVETTRSQNVNVNLREVDGADAVEVVEKAGAA